MTDFKKIFMDTAPIIYYLEKSPQYFEVMQQFLHTCHDENRKIITSAITIEEYCVYPYRTENSLLIRRFNLFLNMMDIEIVPISRLIAEKAAKIRARYKDFKSMDALQLAVAVLADCDLFLTNDKQLRQFHEITCMTGYYSAPSQSA